jgi:hypothetical protein
LNALFGSAEVGQVVLWWLSNRRAQWLSLNALEEAATVEHVDNLYLTVALHDQELALRLAGKTDPALARGSIESSVGIPALWADIDVRGPAHKRDDLPPSFAEARALIEAFPLRPAVIVHSGNGLQPWWLFKEPWIFDGPGDRASAQHLARRFHATLDAYARERGWSLDDVSDLAHVLRLPETFNTKRGQRKPVEIVDWHPEHRFEPSEFEPYLIEDSPARTAGPGQRLDTAEVLAGVPEGQRDVALFRLACKLRAADVPQSAAESLILEAARNCDPPFPEKEALAKVSSAYSRYAAGGSSRSLPGEPPRPLHRQLAPANTFPSEALGEILGGAAQAIQEISRAPYAICGQSVLAAATLGVQAFANLKLPTGAIRPLSGYFLSVASSGERKTSADRLALAPVAEREEVLATIYAQDRQAYERDRAVWEQQHRQELKRRNATPAAKRAALQALGPPPTEPPVPLLTCPEPTFEGLTKLFAAGWPSLGVFSSEGGQFIGGHGMNSDNRLKTASGLSGLWDGDPIKRVRAIDGSAFLPGRRLALHLLAQPGVAAAFLADPLLEDQGLLSRLLVAAPDAIAGTRFWREVTVEASESLDRYQQRLLEILMKPLPLADDPRDGLKPRTLPFSPLARELWIRFVNHVEQLLGPDGDYASIRSLANKLPEHAARLAAVISLSHDLDAAELSEEDLARGIELAKFYAQEALRLFEAGATDPDLMVAVRLLQWLQQTWPEPVVSLPDIYQRGPRSIRDQRTARRIVTHLEDHGWLEPVPGGGEVAGTQRRVVWRIVQS